ncbi:MAG: P22 coat protein [Clostridia bacterium]|nr:P22 coat protein [Clostridia bacterium]
MANTFITLKSIARRALPRLMDELVFPNLIYRDYSDAFSDLGDTVQVRKPALLTASDFDESQGVSYEDIREDSVEVKLDRLATVDVAAGAVETALSLNSEEKLMRDFIEPAACALAEKINSDGLELYKDVAACVGTAGTAVSNLSDLAAVRRALNLAKAPQGSRAAVLDPEADAALITVPALVNAEKSGDTKALRQGSLGRVFGIDYYTTQAVKKHVTGLTASSGVKLASAVSAGASSLSLTGKLVKGDLLLIAGDSYTVTQDTAQASSNAINSVKVYPALKAYAANTAVTPVGSHTANLAFDTNAFAFVTRPLINPDGQGVESYVTNHHGLSLRVTKGYDQKYKKSTYSMDVLYGFKTVYPELAVRVLG